MAIYDSGVLGRLPSVNECSSHPSKSNEMCSLYGIDQTSIMLVGGKEQEVVCVPPVKIGDSVYEFYRHPELFISDTATMWRENYKIKEKYGTKLEYDDFHPCYIEAVNIYENYKGALSVK